MNGDVLLCARRREPPQYGVQICICTRNPDSGITIRNLNLIIHYEIFANMFVFFSSDPMNSKKSLDAFLDPNRNKKKGILICGIFVRERLVSGRGTPSPFQ